MSLMNTLTDFPYRKYYYFRKPWKFFQECWWNVKAAWERATRGYAWRDAVEMDEYLLHLIPAMLREIASADAYPGDDNFPTREAWQDAINALADVFESVQEENWTEGQNEWEDEFHNVCVEYFSRHPNLTTTSRYTPEEAKEIKDLYWAREQELRDERNKLILDAYQTLAKYHNYLWI